MLDQNLKKLTKGLLLLGIAGTLMGNQSCDKPVEVQERMLRRRVQMGKIQAPPIELPSGLGQRKFDFAYVANMQMYDILRKTQSFSTATVDPNAAFDPSGLSEEEKSRFNQCGDEEQDVQNFDLRTHAKIGASYKASVSKSAACLINMPQAIISGAVLDFQLVSGGGVSVGLKDIPFLQAFSVNFEKYELAVELMAKAPLERGDHFFSTTIKNSYGKKWDLGAKLDLGMLSLGPKYYFQTPLRKVVDEGLTSAITELRDNWSKDDPWYAMVMRSCDKYIYINGGYGNDAGLKVGDLVKITNVKYFWDGEVCQSYLHSEITDKVVAYAKITNVGRNMSEAQIIENDPKYPHLPDLIYPGARVYLEKSIEKIQAEAAAASKSKK